MAKTVWLKLLGVLAVAVLAFSLFALQSPVQVQAQTKTATGKWVENPDGSGACFCPDWSQGCMCTIVPMQ